VIPHVYNVKETLQVLKNYFFKNFTMILNKKIDDCTKCDTTSFLLNNKCLSTCPTSYYNKVTDNTCDECDVTCMTCTGPLNTQCLTC